MQRFISPLSILTLHLHQPGFTGHPLHKWLNFTAAAISRSNRKQVRVAAIRYISKNVTLLHRGPGLLARLNSVPKKRYAHKQTRHSKTGPTPGPQSGVGPQIEGLSWATRIISCWFIAAKIIFQSDNEANLDAVVYLFSVQRAALLMRGGHLNLSGAKVDYHGHPALV